MEDIILVGGGGHCISTIDVIEAEGKFNIIGILDVKENIGNTILGYKIIGEDNDIPQLVSNCKNFAISVGQINSSKLREKIYALIKSNKGKLPVIKSPRAHVSKHSTIEEGSIIYHSSVVNANTKIGKCAIINTLANIEHDVTIGDFSHISTGVMLNGTVTVGNSCFIGSSTTVYHNITIANNTVISANSLVKKNILKEGGIYAGNPTKKIR